MALFRARLSGSATLPASLLVQHPKALPRKAVMEQRLEVSWISYRARLEVCCLGLAPSLVWARG